jgi:phage FluMu gp28-like protein
VIEVPEIEHVAGPLHRATVKIMLATNAFDCSRAQHAQVAQSLPTALALPVTTVSLFDGAADGLCLRGLHIRSQTDQAEESHWRSTLELVAGISTT